ncbi:response regulator [Parvularcula sp. IMCC14364]|uniref:response regulator n=1 Tax=Parvularcula sp. IMCC14364 TaxID=3067902 RepID=UPI0027414A15|nr:response regulator [Parvularcula sp. IMCC14364]
MTITPTDILDTLSELVVVTDTQQRCLYVNEAWCRLFGGTQTDWQGKALEMFAQRPPARLNAVSGDIATPGRFENMFSVNERVYWLEWQQTDSVTGHRTFIGRDITDRKAEEITLRATARNAETGNDTKMRFLATMSHEMRTPLNGILGMTGLMMDTGLDANQKAYAEAIRESGSALLALINDILDYSKIDAGRIDLEESVVDPLSLAQSVAELLSPRAAHKDLEIATYVDPSVPLRLMADEARLRQVLLNLAGNGVKFTETGGVTIEIRAEHHDEPGVENIRIDVHDTGVGIPQEDLTNIFEEFAQADSSHARKFEGTGLGLAIARRIVQAMGGTMSVKSKLNVGSVFSFTVPLKAKTDHHSTRYDCQIQDPVLLVTSSTILKRIVRLQLESAGVRQFHVTEDAEDAHAFLSRHRNAILLCDLPFAAQHGKKLSMAASHSLVLLSPVARGRLETFRRIGFDGYLIKPMRQSSLFRRLSDRDIPQQKTERLDSPATAPAFSPQKYRVLLAEDNQINAVLATAIIKRAGHHVDVAGNGSEALYAVQSAPYDVVLMDMHMPEMDGLEAARKIRELAGSERHVPIIALTANAMSSDRDNCLAVGMNDFLTKPFEPQELIGLIEKWGRASESLTAGADAGHQASA